MNALALTFGLMCSLMSTNPLGTVAVDQVDLIEYNHFYDEHGRHVFDQLIFYDWSRRDARYQIRDWRLVKSTTQVPHKDAKRSLYTATWHDGQILRQVRATSIRETWTQYDPELVERANLPKENRRELFPARRLEVTATTPADPEAP